MALLFFLLLIQTVAVEAQFTFTTNNGAITITSYTGSDNAVTIPALTNGLPVVSLGPLAFNRCESLVGVTIPASITNFELSPFFNCTNLLAVYFQGNVPVDDYPFAPGIFYNDPEATLYYLPGATNLNATLDGLPVVQWDPQILSQLTYTTNNGAIKITSYLGTGGAAVLPATINGLPVGSLGSLAFYRCTNLTSVTIPASITNFAWPSFISCTNLLAVYFQGDVPADAYPAAGPIFDNDPNATFYYMQGIISRKASLDGLPVVQWNPQVLYQLIYTNNNGAITVTGYLGAGGAVVLPATINGLPVTSIGSNAFLNCNGLTGIKLPNLVTNLGNEAFAGCTSLTNITIPNSTAGSGSFSNCVALTTVTLSGNITAISSSEFSGCTALANLQIPAGITNLGDDAFQGCTSLSGVYYQGSAPAADLTVFSGDGVETNFYFPKTSGWGAMFAGRPAVPVLFTYTNLGGAITIKSYIGIDGTVTIPDTLNGVPVISLGYAAFNGCASVTNVNLGGNITSIAGQAFVGCPNLLAINVAANNPDYSSVDGVLFNLSGTTIFCYPGGRDGDYTIPDGVTQIANYAFQACPGLTSLTVPGSVTSIATLAFNADGDLTAIYFAGNAPAIAWEAFNIQNTAIVYYLPGTTGWNTNSSGLPTAFWPPRVQNCDAGFGVRTNQFGFNINWSSGQVVVVEAATNMVNPVWIPVATNTLTGSSSYFSDPQSTNFPGRFYRLRSP
ncbi:MAG TPA: leucine-rich repeat protein [Candidatus Sulfotelmatobacter sp.]|jgi:hypothetical protein|nr:leucine-rich repeat protein [Candidatus Sulfotelmatobacter sp.]